MKSSLLISISLAIVVAAVAASASLAGRSSVQVLPGFRSPTGNIKCFVAGKALYCSLGHADYAHELQDRCMGHGSGVDWHGFRLRATKKATVYCTSNPPYNMGTQRPSTGTLAYGKTFRHGAFKCTSRVTGVTCRNLGGHSLFVSSQAWRAT